MIGEHPSWSYIDSPEYRYAGVVLGTDANGRTVVLWRCTHQHHCHWDAKICGNIAFDLREKESHEPHAIRR